ncbi:MAG: ABC transporter substrate-binding protein [Chloroflexota bacterium]|nr:ABC transporter substrate-binding protein [Chloroflexota bacterium]
MKKLITAGLIACFVILSCVGCAKNEATETSAPEREFVTVIDKTGRYVEVPCPVKRIVSLNSGMAALVCAFGEADRLVGRDVFCSFPSYMKDVRAVGKSSQPNLELIAEQNPDVLVADPMLYDANRAKIEAAGIPVYVDSTSDPERLLPLISNFGLMLGKKDKADEIADYIGGYIDLVNGRMIKLELEDGSKPKVFFEFRSAYKSASAESTFHKPIAAAGGVNIAAGQPVSTPRLSPEWILEQNPEIIVRRLSGDADLEEMKAFRDEIISRPGLKGTDAVKEDRVYIIKADIFLTVRYPVGLLYYAKWFHPDLFADIDPAVVHQEIVEKFFGPGEWEKMTETFVCTK